jgi:plasmid stability protein
MKTTLDLPDALVKQIKLRAVHDGRKLKDMFAELLTKGLAAESAGSPTQVRADADMMKRRRELVDKFVSGEWGVELADYEQSQQADLASAEKRAQAWRD